MKLETDITAELMASDRLPVGTSGWEVKRTTGNTLPFKSFANHQIESLFKANKQRLHIKIRDVGRHRKNFDGMTLDHSPAWCICCYPDDNKDGYVAYAIDINVWYNERRTSGKTSLSKERAKELGALI